MTDTIGKINRVKTGSDDPDGVEIMIVAGDGSLTLSFGKAIETLTCTSADTIALIMMLLDGGSHAFGDKITAMRGQDAPETFH